MSRDASPLRRAQTLEELTRQNVETISEMEHSTERARTRGERVADAVAAAVGSWTFIIVQSALLLAWMVINVIAWTRHWDPFPFVLLNLVLSFQAAFAGPIIMISQNRQARVADRRNRLDLQIDLLAEQENTEMLRLLRLLCAKLEISIADDSPIHALEQHIKPAKVLREIDRTIEPRNPDDRRTPRA